MSAPAHAERAHALLGASGASRWIACPPSARLTEKVTEKRSEYADEGTAAHELSEVKLQQLLIPNNSARRKELETALAEAMVSTYYGPEMENAVNDYVDIVAERFLAAKVRSQDAVIMFEQRLDFSEWVPEGYGTGDVIIISDGVMDVIDLKYGKGVPVSAFDNPQMRLYALGAWQEYDYLYGIEEIHMTIVQPRLDSVSTDIVQVEDLLEWAETVVKPAAALAFAGEGEFKAGEHCRWCKVKGNCRARADENMKALEYEFRDPALMTPEEIGSILFVAEQLQTWAKDVQEYAFGQAKSGNKIPLWKLVEGRSNRTITDKEAARAVLEKAKIDQMKYLKPQDMFGISDLEKNIGKKELAKLLDGLIIKPPGKPVLVPETDRRPELNSVDQDFAGEDFDING
ncbi:DUF2800 domain-containing protein [Paenibacillus fonticola]|uniref:DUF2800 domain-containing protein n=1 Tax=Paenibacillus fonticola TaxID=379896 RepID=UPI0003681183|nr:DUF2800 domain-containing protein [Paenibacillus fonticola]